MLSAFTARPIIELRQRDKSKIESILAHGMSCPSFPRCPNSCGRSLKLIERHRRPGSCWSQHGRTSHLPFERGSSSGKATQRGLFPLISSGNFDLERIRDTDRPGRRLPGCPVLDSADGAIERISHQAHRFASRGGEVLNSHYRAACHDKRGEHTCVTIQLLHIFA